VFEMREGLCFRNQGFLDHGSALEAVGVGVGATGFAPTLLASGRRRIRPPRPPQPTPPEVRACGTVSP
jgi:hypothetical protein